MRRDRITMLFLTVPSLAHASGKDVADPAILILLLLGVAAILGGLGTITDMRRKHMQPPRPRDTQHRQPPEQPPTAQP